MVEGRNYDTGANPTHLIPHMAEPLVSCLMVTANRSKLAARSIACLKAQTWTNWELILLDDGEEDYTPLLDGIPAERVTYLKRKKDANAVLGHLRNITLDHAKGTYVAQWDDDDWYHPDRLRLQVEALEQGADACCIQAALMHLDTPDFIAHPYIGKLKEGVPGSIVHRNDPTIRYPETRRAEDTVFLLAWMKRRYVCLPKAYAYLFIRCFHGNNTWEQEHFLRRIRNSPVDALGYLWHAQLRNKVTDHRNFRLSEQAQEAFASYMALSKALELHQTRT